MARDRVDGFFEPVLTVRPSPAFRGAALCSVVEDEWFARSDTADVCTFNRSAETRVIHDGGEFELAGTGGPGDPPRFKLAHKRDAGVCRVTFSGGRLRGDAVLVKGP